MAAVDADLTPSVRMDVHRRPFPNEVGLFAVAVGGTSAMDLTRGPLLADHEMQGEFGALVDRRLGQSPKPQQMQGAPRGSPQHEPYHAPPPRSAQSAASVRSGHSKSSARSRRPESSALTHSELEQLIHPRMSSPAKAPVAARVSSPAKAPVAARAQHSPARSRASTSRDAHANANAARRTEATSTQWPPEEDTYSRPRNAPPAHAPPRVESRRAPPPRSVARSAVDSPDEDDVPAPRTYRMPSRRRRGGGSVASGSSSVYEGNVRVEEDAATFASETSSQFDENIAAMERMELDAIMADMRAMRTARIITDEDMPKPNDTLVVAVFKHTRARALYEANVQVSWWQTMIGGGVVVGEDMLVGWGLKLFKGFSQRLAMERKTWDMALRTMYRQQHKGPMTPMAVIQTSLMRVLTDTLVTNWQETRALEGRDDPVVHKSPFAPATAEPAEVPAEFVESATQHKAAPKASAHRSAKKTAMDVVNEILDGDDDVLPDMPKAAWERRLEEFTRDAAHDEASAKKPPAANARAPSASQPPPATSKADGEEEAALRIMLEQAIRQRDAAVRDAKAAAAAAATAVHAADQLSRTPKPARSAARSTRSTRSVRLGAPVDLTDA